MNAKEELLEKLDGLSNILCAKVRFGNEYYERPDSFNLKCNYDVSNYVEFINFMNRSYDEGYGIQELFGTVWLTDGTWLERGEYDGSEWWEHKVCPKIPDELK